MSKAFVIRSIVVIVLTLALALIYYHRALDEVLPIPETGVVFEVARGESLNSVLRRMQQQELIHNIVVAKLYARQHDLAAQIKAGELKLEPGISIRNLFELLVSNKRVEYRVVLVEGSTFREARKNLSEHEKINTTLAELSDEEVLQRLKAQSEWPSDHPEGSLYPDTYFFHKGDTDWSILQRAHLRLMDVLTEEWNGKSDRTAQASPYEALILASIVEKETGHPEERDEIAGVFTRRLQKGMRLQTDPTVIYGLGDRYQGNITRAHLREHTAYNTYRINGLPPTPIALAGREAIHAALHPAAGETLYFVAKGDGSHYFSKTFEEHNKAVRKYQLSRRADYRSTHQSSPKAEEVN